MFGEILSRLVHISLLGYHDFEEFVAHEDPDGARNNLVLSDAVTEGLDASRSHLIAARFLIDAIGFAMVSG